MSYPLWLRLISYLHYSIREKIRFNQYLRFQEISFNQINQFMKIN